MDKLRRYGTALPALLILTGCAVLLFHRLGALPVRQWDEARNAVSALEMLQNHNYIVRYFGHSPDYWDVKPPLLIWLQVISLKIFGLNETAVRLPSACAGLLTVILILLYFKRYQKSMIPAFLAVLILVTSPGYMGRHVARTGDHDALLVLFTTAILFLCFEILYNGRNSNRLLTFSALCFFLGILTKSIAVFMILPGLATMTLFFRRHKRILASPWFHISLASIILLTSAYYLWRESLQTGYIRAVWNGELFPRYFNTREAFDSGSVFYYVKLLFASRNPYWIYFLIASLIMVPFISDSKRKAFAVFLMINALMYLIIISAGTKNMWYDAPLYPMFATITGISAHDLLIGTMNRIRNSPCHGSDTWPGKWLNWINGTEIRVETRTENGTAANMTRIPKGNGIRNLKLVLTAAVLAAIVFAYPVISTWREISRTTEHYWDEEIYGMSHYLSKTLAGSDHAAEITAILFNGYNGHLLFYTEAIGISTGRVIPFRTFSSVRSGDILLLSQQEVADNMGERFRYEVLEEEGRAKLIRIISAVPPR